MPEAGGSTTQSGILYQNSVAALYLGRLLDVLERPQSEQVKQVRVESPDHVDDIVVTYADEHVVYHQAKEHVTVDSNEWQILWNHFDEQFRDTKFQRGRDKLCLCIGYGNEDHYQLKEICLRSSSYDNSEEWRGALSKRHINLVDKKIKPHLVHVALTDDYVFRLIQHVVVTVLDREEIEQERISFWMPATNLHPIALFRLLRDQASREARVKGIFTADKLRQSLIAELPDLTFVVPFDIEQLKTTVKLCSALLRQHKHTISGINKPIERDVVAKIIEWAKQDESKEKPVAMLLDQAGMGKTVVMRDVLCRLEAQGIAVLAIKADLQLSDIRRLVDLENKLNLPASLEDIIGRLARLGRFVVLIDQLDALSLSLAHDQKAMKVAVDLIARLCTIPNVRILISCRIFDRNSDPYLKSIPVGREFNIPPLTDLEVSTVLLELGSEFAQLTSATQYLLRTPLHLDLFAQAILAANIPNNEMCGISSLQELYAIIWQDVILRRGDGVPSISARIAVLNRLTDYMAKWQRIAAPQSIFYAVGTDEEMKKAVEWLASISILLPSKTEWVFMHQTFFDYCYARRFVERGDNLMDVLLASSQGLFERPQMIHIMAYLRGQNHQQYIHTFRQLLQEKNLRFHLRDHLWRWFGALANPSEDEWLLAQAMIFDPNHLHRFMRTIVGNIGWLNRLEPQLVQWLQQGEDSFIDQLTLPYLQSIQHIVPSKVVDLLRPFLGLNKQWNHRIHLLVKYDKHHAPATIQLYEQVFYLVPYDRSDLWKLRVFADQFPAYACRMLHHIFEDIYIAHVTRMTEEQKRDSSSHPPNSAELFQELYQSERAVAEALEAVSHNDPQLFLAVMLPWMEKVLLLRSISDEEVGYFASDSFSHLWYSNTFRIRYAFLNGIIEALVLLARNNSTEFRLLAAKLARSSYLTPQHILTRIYRTLPEIYSEDALNFLLADQRRFDLGEREQYDTRQVIAAIYPHLNKGQQSRLEEAILNYQPLHKGGIRLTLDILRWWRIEQFRLLRSIPENYLSSNALRRLQELERKFVGYKLSDEPNIFMSGWVSSPIETDTARKMSNRQWLRAMRRYEGKQGHREFFKGGAAELGQVLFSLIKETPSRFYKLISQVPTDIDEHYVRAIVSGFAESDAPVDWTWSSIYRFIKCADKECKIAIARAVTRHAQSDVPSNIIDSLEIWVQQPQEKDEKWWKENNTLDRIVTNFINSIRGCAFEALMRVYHYRNNAEAIDSQWQLLDFAARDPSTMLRVGAIEYLRYMLQHDWNRALILFAQLIDRQDAAWESTCVYNFLYYGYRQNFLRLKPFIEKMMDEEQESVKERGARLACLAALSEGAMESAAAIAEAQVLADKTVKGNVAWRRGAAHIFSENLSYSQVQVACQYQLEHLLDDHDKNVRDSIDYIFASLRTEHFYSLRRFIESYVCSELHTLDDFFAEFMLMNGLGDPEWSLSAIEMMLSKKIPPVSGIEEVIRLVLQIYRRSANEGLKLKAMDVFDSLMERYSHYTYKVLNEFDRA